MSRDNRESKGLLWKLPVITSKDIGKLGPGFGFGAGCGVGLGAGLFGGAGLGAGFPGLQFGIGIGAGCGIGLGFGYGGGKGIAYDDKKRHSNVGDLLKQNEARKLPSEDRINALLDDLSVHTKKLINATTKQLEKWR